MRRFAVILGILLAQPALAEGPRDTIAGTINGQMQAFSAQDATAAFEFASPQIKRIFGTAQNFAGMVERTYPMIWNHGAVRLLELREAHGGQWQRVLVMDQAGRGHLLEYQMIEAAEGWQINAVYLLPAPGEGV